MSEITAKLDYFSVTVFLKQGVGHQPVTNCIMSDLLQLSESNSDAFFEKQPFGGRGYAQISFCPVNGLILYRYPNSGNAGHCHIEIKGEPLASIGVDGVHRFLTGIVEAGLTFRASRVDIAFDHVPCPPIELYNAWKARSVKTRLHYKSHDWRENDKGATFYWGSIKGIRQGVCYNMRSFNRVELRCREGLAEALGNVVASGDDLLLWQVAASELNSMAQFPDDLGHWGWVQEIAAGAERCYVPKPPKKAVGLSLVAKTRDRFMSLCSELAIISNALGIDPEAVTQTIASVSIDDKGTKKIRDLRRALACL